MLALVAALALSAVTVPPQPSGRVNDYARVLSAQTRQRLEQGLRQAEAQSSNQVVVVTLPSLDGEDIADVAYRIGQTWGLGQSGRDNGVLLVLSMAERRSRIEVGKGLEGALTDLESSIILNEVMRPYLARGDVDGAVVEGSRGILQAVQGEYRGTGRAAGGERAQSGGRSPIGTLAFFGLLLVLFIFFPRAGMFLLFSLGGGGGRRGGGGFGGGGGRFGGGGASGSW